MAIRPVRTVREAATELGVWEPFTRGVVARLDPDAARQLIDRLGALPVRASHAVGLLGSYVHRGGEPIAVRLQPAQERPLQGTTLLHELAHACEHLNSADPRRHRCTHGAAWRGWAEAFGIAPERVARSAALGALRAARLKPVAVCETCGCVFLRLRRLPRRRQWLHPQCGNGRVVALPARGR
jgi:hypothetical protein